MPVRITSCSCGQLRIQVEGEPLGVGLYQCLACQQRTGSVFAAMASAPRVSVYECRRHAWVALPSDTTAIDTDPT